MEKEIYVKFWGVRGTVPTTAPNMQKYGGNTSCVELICNGRHIVFDAGTGLCPLGNNTDHFHTDIFLSHTHLDHIQGLPFYKPLHTDDSNVALWAGHLLPENTVAKVMSSIMQSPVFPLTLNDVRSRVEFNDFLAGEDIKNQGLLDAGVTVKTMPLKHPDRATAYKIICNGISICYVTDVEHEIGKIDADLVAFLKDADMFIYDSTYDDDDFTPYIGWGHSTWQQGVKIADAANVEKFIAFHHAPEATDKILDARAEKLTQMRGKNKAFIAKEGMSFHFAPSPLGEG